MRELKGTCLNFGELETSIDGNRDVEEHKGNKRNLKPMHAQPDRSKHIAALRASLGRVATAAAIGECLPFELNALDAKLAGGGLLSGGLHEMIGASTSLADDAATTLFIAGVAARFAARADAPAVWATTSFDLYAPGLEQAGLDPAHVLFAEARNDDQLLAVVEDAVRDGSPAAVVGEVRRASMTATRRLQLAASEARVPVLLFRRWRRPNVEPYFEPSAATTRWRIACAPSGPLRVAGVGRSRWMVDLVRQRGGAPFSLVLEGCDETGRLAVPAPARHRTAAAHGAAHPLAA